ncbi:zinc-binding protein, partial [Halobellus sp. Atlit-31R]
GCPLLCAKNCLARHGVAPDMHWQLGEHGVRKRYHAEFDQEQAEAMVAHVAGELQGLGREPGHAPSDGSAAGAPLAALS